MQPPAYTHIYSVDHVCCVTSLLLIGVSGLNFEPPLAVWLQAQRYLHEDAC